MSYRFRLVDFGKNRRAVLVEKQNIQRQLLIAKSEIRVEAERLGLSYDELVRLVKEES